MHNDVEFTCIVYYANEFEMLRRQCGVHQIMIESLCRCQSWVASGGKSKSRFYKTQGITPVHPNKCANQDCG